MTHALAKCQSGRRGGASLFRVLARSFMRRRACCLSFPVTQERCKRDLFQPMATPWVWNARDTFCALKGQHNIENKYIALSGRRFTIGHSLPHGNAMG